MTTGHVILGLLTQGHQHGYDLKRRHDDVFPAARPMAFGQVYAALERLKKRGHVEVAATERVDGPERTVFAITAGGISELANWLDTIDDPAPNVANPLATKATIALLTESEAAARRYLTRQRAAHLDRMRYYTRVKTDPHSSMAIVLAADYAIAHLDADLQWLESAIGRIHSLDPATCLPPDTKDPTE
jgi:DNA-binding PadR family transcriptional regulator